MCGTDISLHVTLHGAFVVAVVTAESSNLFQER
jgi:hypothetical protein